MLTVSESDQAYGITLSSKAVDLMSKMMAPEERRSSLDEVMQHAWLRTGLTPKLTPKPSLTARLQEAARSTDLKSRRMPLSSSSLAAMDTAITPMGSPLINAGGALAENSVAPASPRADNTRRLPRASSRAMNICANLVSLAAN